MNSGKYGLAKNRTYEKITSSSYATTSSYAATSSYALTASYALNAGGGGLNPTTGYIPYNNSSVFGDSNIFYDGTNVGIGTITPAYKLDVNGTGRFYGGLTAGAIFGAGATINLASDSYMLVTSTTGKNAGYTANRFSTSEYASFDLLTGANISTGWSMQMIPNQTRLDFVDRTTLTPSITILTGSGNVGIGTTTPVFKLDISGSGNYTNGLTVTGSLNVSGSITASSLNILKAGSGSAASFTGTPLILAITFGTAFTNNSYAVQVTGEDPRVWSIQSKSSSGFTINSNSSVALTGPVYWVATPFNS
jgi:hypothetical protein